MKTNKKWVFFLVLAGLCFLMLGVLEFYAYQNFESENKKMLKDFFLLSALGLILICLATFVYFRSKNELINYAKNLANLSTKRKSGLTDTNFIILFAIVCLIVAIDEIINVIIFEYKPDYSFILVLFTSTVLFLYFAINLKKTDKEIAQSDTLNQAKDILYKNLEEE